MLRRSNFSVITILILCSSDVLFIDRLSRIADRWKSLLILLALYSISTIVIAQPKIFLLEKSHYVVFQKHSKSKPYTCWW